MPIDNTNEYQKAIINLAQLLIAEASKCDFEGSTIVEIIQNLNNLAKGVGVD